MKVLFICHAASRNGATIMLLEFAKWVKNHTEHEVHFWISGTGELLDEFRALGRTTVLRKRRVVLQSIDRWGCKRGPVARRLVCRAMGLGDGFDVAWVNTAAAGWCIPYASVLSRRTVWHIHELGYALAQTLASGKLKEYATLVTRLVAASESVRCALLERNCCDPGRVDLVHEFAGVRGDAHDLPIRQRYDELVGLEWPRESFVVGGCGGMGWRKGTDVFLQIAARLCAQENGENYRFLWVGGAAAGDERLKFMHDARLLGIDDRVKVIATTSDVAGYYRLMDVFALTSREDPFPLVMLEAGAFGVPTVCFAESGGGPEYVGEDAGFIVPYLDVEKFADAVERMRSDPELKRRLGDNARGKVRSNFTIETQGPKLLEVIEKCMRDV